MTKFIIGTKQGMTQIFDEKGRVHPVTVLAAPAITVTQVKTREHDGYEAVQVGYGVQKEQRINKAQRPKGLFRGLREFRLSEAEIGELKAGSTVDVSVFAVGDVVHASAVSKGKGFAGVVKRYGFKGGPRSHGQKHSERERGSSGGGPGRAGGRVVLGMRMAGRMGGDNVTVKNLKIVKVDAERSEILIEGAVPGRRGTLVEVIAK
jgi:large subunit ribosomal protein L3